jgi:adenylate kinase
MVLDRIAQPDAGQGFVLDGFPRNVDQARALDEALARDGKSIDKVIYIKVSTDELVRRLAGRWNCPQCEAVYHELSMPPKKSGVCDSCGGELHQREDDRPDVVRTRLEINLKETKPLLEYYGADGKLTEVNGDMEVKKVKEKLLAAMSRPQKVS